MKETRRARLESLILQELSGVVRGLKDPRIDPGLTLTGVEVSPDGAYATVKVSLLQLLSESNNGAIASDGGPSEESDLNALGEGEGVLDEELLEETITGLNHSSGFIRRHLAKVLTTKHIPLVTFKADLGLNNTVRINQLLEGLKSRDSQ